MPGMIWPVVAYAPKAATKPIIAIQPLNFSASGVTRLNSNIAHECKGKVKECKGGTRTQQKLSGVLAEAIFFIHGLNNNSTNFVELNSTRWI